MRQRKHSMSKVWVVLPVLVVVACQPRPIPPQPTLTPPLVTLNEREINVEGWSIPRLVGWRVVTSEAGSPVVIIQVSPDDQQIITFAEHPQSAPPEPASTEPIARLARVFNLAHGQAYVYATAPRSFAETLQTLLDELAEQLIELPSPEF